MFGNLNLPVRDQLLEVICKNLAANIYALDPAEENIAVKNGNYVSCREATIDDKATQSSVCGNVRLLDCKSPHRELCAWHGQGALEAEIFKDNLQLHDTPSHWLLQYLRVLDLARTCNACLSCIANLHEVSVQ